MYRWLLDTNIIISGLFWSGKESELLKLAVAGKYRAIISEFVLRETKAVIAAKFSEMADKAETVLNLLVESAEKYPLLSAQEVNQFINSRDLEIDLNKGDLIILATAFTAKAEAIVTGDKDFHKPEINELIQIIETAQALQKLKS